ncbi:DUF2861 family protein [Vibrio sp. WXL103]|uniref:DUF2861 family protein n=1 Tax=unclassified Vibrio TaxID=2614977 RepID=UPI003EC84E50
MTPLTQAHQHLLKGSFSEMYSVMVEVLQRDQSPSMREHINDLLVQSFDADCGKALQNDPLPNWLRNVSIKRTSIQSPGQESYRVFVDVTATQELRDVSLDRWINTSIATDNEFEPISEPQAQSRSTNIEYRKTYNLNSRLPMGLYHLNVETRDNQSYSTWVIIEEYKAKQIVRWSNNDSWSIEKNELLNKFCPLPKLSVRIYNYQEDQYQEVWGQTYQANYPTQLEQMEIPPDRYVLSIALDSQRWQGPIIIEQSQIITKTYDISIDEEDLEDDE